VTACIYPNKTDSFITLLNYQLNTICQFHITKTK